MRLKITQIFLNLVAICLALSFAGNAIAVEKRRFNSGYLANTEPASAESKSLKFGDGPLPPSFDLSSRFPPVGQQGSQSSCTAWACAYAARSYYLGLEGENIQKINSLPSPAYIYNQLTKDQVNCSEGTNIGDALNIMKNQGVALLSDFPYSANSSCNKLPSENIKLKAKRYVISDWYEIKKNVETIKKTLFAGNPVVFGMFLNPSFNNSRFQNLGHQNIYTDLGLQQLDSGHAMVIVGYDNNRNAFKVFNSWGKNWGDRGLAWVDYNTMMKQGVDFYFMKVAQSAPPAPAPAPAPAPRPSPSPSPAPAPSPLPNLNVVLPMPADIAKINNKLDIISAGVECGKIKGSVDGWGIIRLDGYIDNQEQLFKLIHTMMKIKGATNVENKVRITPWPLCEIYLHLEAFPSSNTKNITASIVDHPDNTFNVGDTFVIDLKLPNSNGYLYAVYIQSSGDAVKFYWGKKYSPHQNITLGGPGYKISSPIGKEMILLITSPKPIFSNENINTTKPDKKFLTELKTAARESSPKDRQTISYKALEVLTIK